MSGIIFNTNVASLATQRQVARTTDGLRQTFSKLSSGLRIASSADDAAGLAIASALEVDSRAYTQGIRNINDSISAISIQESALNTLVEITTRQRELATQAANGVISQSQRSALNQEAQALASEYERITQSTMLNGISLLSGQQTLTLQAGYSNLSIQIGLPSTIASGGGTGSPTLAGDGTFTQILALNNGLQGVQVAAGDVNGDGVDDLVRVDYYWYYGGYTDVATFIGNGDGSFRAPESFSTSYRDNIGLYLLDVTGDGKADFLNETRGGLIVRVSNGDGTYKPSSVLSPMWGSVLVTGDFDGDGKTDIITNGLYRTDIHLGNGDGTFGAGRTVSPDIADLALVDVNGDGKLDFISTDGVSKKLSVYINNGDGTFKPRVSYTAATNSAGYIELGDFNLDGIIDALVNDTTVGVSVLLGNSDGTFKSPIASALVGADQIARDFDGDGYLDLLMRSGDTNYIALGNGDGTFKSASVTYNLGVGLADHTVGDFNDDGVFDFASVGYDDHIMRVFLGNTHMATPHVAGSGGASSLSSPIDLLTAQSARSSMQTLDQRLTTLNTTVGELGAALSHLSTTVSSMLQARENYDAARSRIVDVDVADETAQLLRFSIRQQTGNAVLAQANQASALALKLLKATGPPG